MKEYVFLSKHFFKIHVSIETYTYSTYKKESQYIS